MARKSKSGRSNTSETRSNTSGRSRRSKRSSRSQTPLRPVQPPVSRFEIAASSGGEAVLPSQKWQSLPCCAGGCCAIYGCCVPCAIATARHRMDGSSWCVNFWCLNIISARNIVRHGYSIKGHCCADVMCGLLCTTCVACQLLEETNRRGSLHDDWSATPSRPRYQQPWKFGLLKCTDDMSTCTYGCCCPLLGAASARTQMDESDWIFNMCCMNPIITRTLIRQGYNIEGTDCQDCCLTCFCLPCSVCQMLNETQHRGRLPTTAPGYNPMAR